MRVFKTLITLFCGLLLLAGASFIALQTEVMQKKIKNLACDYAKENGIELSIEAISGSFPFRFTLEQVAVQRDNGETIYLNGVNVRLNGFALLRGEIKGRFKSTVSVPLAQNLQGSLRGKVCLSAKNFDAKIESRDLHLEKEQLPPLSAKIHAIKEDEAWKGKIQFIPPT